MRLSSSGEGENSLKNYLPTSRHHGYWQLPPTSEEHTCSGRLQTESPWKGCLQDPGCSGGEQPD